jgi:hypothetical protein
MLESFYALFNRLNGYTLPKELSEALNEQRGGALQKEMMQRLQSTIKQVRKTGRKGKVKLTINIEHSGMNKLEIEPEIASNEPKSKLAGRMLFADDQGRLYAKDPDQTEIDFREAEGDGSLREVNS